MMMMIKRSFFDPWATLPLRDFGQLNKSFSFYPDEE